MPEIDAPRRTYRFGGYTLLADERMLMHGNERVHMTPRVFHLLLILVENAGRLVSKETLLNEIWQDSFVEEGNLNSTVSRLRKILGETPTEKKFVETIPRVGYRFIADVEVEPGNEIKPASKAVVIENTITPVNSSVAEFPFLEHHLTQPQPLVVAKASAKRPPHSRWSIAPLLAVILIPITLAIWYWWPHPHAAAEQQKQKNIPIRLTNDQTNEEHGTWTKDGHIRFEKIEEKTRYSYIMNADGTDAHRETSIPGLRSGIWSPDGKKVILTKEGDDTGAVYLANSDGSNEMKLPFPFGNIGWSPDSSKIIYQYGRPNADIYIYTLETGKSEAVVSDPSFDADPSFTPDGRITFISGRDGNLEIYVQNIDGSDLQRLTNHPAHDAFPTFSPDGTQIAFNSNREDEKVEVYIMNADGSNVRRLTSGKGEHQIRPNCWSPDGTQILLHSDESGRDNIYVMNVEPFKPKEIYSDPSAELHFPTYSPDGKKILFQSEPQDKTNEIQLLDVESNQLAVVAKTELPDGYPKFSPDGNWIVFQDRVGGNGEICLVRSDGSGGIQDLTNNPARDASPAWSPDGSKIVFTSNRDGNYDLYQLYIMNADGSDPHRIYYSLGMSIYPSWSPDGREIAFANDKEDGRSGNFEIFSIEPETTTPEKRLTFRPKYDVEPSYSPDGSHIAFVANADGNPEIYLMNSDGSGLLRLTRDASVDGEPSWSPDGKKILFSSNRNGKSSIFELGLE